MRAVYGIALAVGAVGLLVWLAGVALSSNVAGWDRYDPDRRLGTGGRRVVAAVFGFGMAGLSASYAGWPTALAALAAATGATAAAVWAGSSA